MEFSFVLDSVKGALVSGSGSGQLLGVSTDSRNIKAGELFVALRGESYDGHKFVKEAFDKGAAAALLERVPEGLGGGETLVRVEDTLKALGELAMAWRKSLSDIDLAAITGSNGKTTTKEMVSSIISINHNTLKNSGNFNNLIGLPLTLLDLNDSYEMAVVELGMNDFGEIRRLSRIARPDVGTITNIGRAHLEKLGGIEGVAEAKGEIVEGFSSHSIFVVNADDPRVQEIADETECQKITFGIRSEGSFVTGSEIEEKDFSGITFYMSVAGEGFTVTLNTIGVHNVMNALCAAGIAYGLGCLPEEIKEGLERFRPVNQRLEVSEAPQGFKVINDAYNANPESMRRAIDELIRLKGRGRAVAVLGDMLELGDASDTEHRGIGEYLSASGVDYVITYGNFGTTVIESLSNGTEGDYAPTHEEAASLLKSYADSGDLVLIKGSRGMRMEEVIKNLT